MREDRRATTSWPGVDPGMCRRGRISAVLVLTLGCGAGGGVPIPGDVALDATAAADAPAPTADASADRARRGDAPPELPPGAKRVTLTCCNPPGIRGEGWNLAAGQVAADPADADFVLLMGNVVSLAGSPPMVAFCERTPPGGALEFLHVGEVPSDTAGCRWGPASLGGNTADVASHIGGRGFIVRDRTGVPAGRLLIVSASGCCGRFALTFDITGL